MKSLLTRIDSGKMEKAASMLKVLAHPKRLAIIDLLGKEDKMTVTEIYQYLNLPQAIASQHLITLKDKGVLTSFKVGTKIFYSLSVPALTDVISCLEEACESM
jgi:DNA-binding transcriptional ArsR family regulator